MARWAARRVLATLGVVAMLTPALTPLATSDLAAYRPDHGHLHAGGVVPDHAHPWDERRGAPSPLGMTVFDALAIHPVATQIAPVPVAPEAQQEHLEVVFTHGDDGSPGRRGPRAARGGSTLSAAPADVREVARSQPTPTRTRPLSVPTEPLGRSVSPLPLEHSSRGSRRPSGRAECAMHIEKESDQCA